jgi:penicillin-binding protein 2
MHEVVANKTKGTAYRMTIDKDTGIQVAGKTGTAEYGEDIVDAQGHKYKRSHAWFTSFAPYDNPEIATVVLIEGGDSALEGSTFAVPITDQILKDYFTLKK